ncbi:hypothetical protein GQ53DRAFT_32638 [Thozetella sp. PMI_491]|nr:hypothetical protein GQ53DRAFT_32638 [Thozetella sp. PMI_491]
MRGPGQLVSLSSSARPMSHARPLHSLALLASHHGSAPRPNSKGEGAFWGGCARWHGTRRGRSAGNHRSALTRDRIGGPCSSRTPYPCDAPTPSGPMPVVAIRALMRDAHMRTGRVNNGVPGGL